MRVSAVGERGGDESYGSPSVQREAMERWAEYKQVELARVFVDEDQSGGTQDRPGLVAAIERAVNGETGGIIAYNISRFSRVTEGGLRDLRRLKEADARLVFATEDIDTSTVHGRMIFTILLATHEAALEQIKAGWKVTKARAIEQGRQIGPTPPGYRRTTERNGRPKGSLVPDETAPAITAAYEAVAKAQDVRAALPILREAIPTKTFVARKQTTAERYGVELGEEVTVPATWNTTTARRLLSSRVYLGEAYYGDGEIAPNPNAHEPLIDGTTWRLVQKIIGISEELKRAPKGDFPLSRRCICATCGGVMIGSRMGADSRRAYRCTTNQRRSDNTCERPATVSADPLEAHVHELLVRYAQDFERRELEAADALGPATSYELGPEDMRPDDEEPKRAVEDAEAELARIEAMDLPEAAKAAALEAQDRVVSEARMALELVRAEASDDAPAPPNDAEIGDAPVERLGEFLGRWRLAARVDPGRGRLAERVRLERAD